MAINERVFEYFTSKYKEEYCTQLLEHCSTGRSIETFAAKINNIPEALAFWSSQYPDFEACLRVAYWKSYAWWEDQIIDDQKNIREFKTLTPQIFNSVMKNRFRWRDSADDIMITIGKMSNEDLEERVKNIMKAKEQVASEDRTIRSIENKRKED